MRQFICSGAVPGQEPKKTLSNVFETRDPGFEDRTVQPTYVTLPRNDKLSFSHSSVPAEKKFPLQPSFHHSCSTFSNISEKDAFLLQLFVVVFANATTDRYFPANRTWSWSWLDSSPSSSFFFSPPIASDIGARMRRRLPIPPTEMTIPHGCGWKGLTKRIGSDFNRVYVIVSSTIPFKPFTMRSFGCGWKRWPRKRFVDLVLSALKKSRSIEEKLVADSRFERWARAPSAHTALPKLLIDPLATMQAQDRV